MIGGIIQSFALLWFPMEVSFLISISGIFHRFIRASTEMRSLAIAIVMVFAILGVVAGISF